MGTDQRAPLLTGRLGLFLTAMFFVEASRTLTMVQVPVFLRELGADIRHIGLFFTLSMIFPLILRILGGWLSDTIGRLRALSIGGIAGVLGYIAYAVSPRWEVALAAPALLAVASALVLPSRKAYIADYAPEEIRGRLFGLTEAFITCAWIVGPPIGGFIAEVLDYRWMFKAAVITYGLATIVLTILQMTERWSPSLTRSPPTMNSLRSSLKEMIVLTLSGGLVTWILITDGVQDVSHRISFDLMPVYLSEIGGLGKQSIGLLDGIFGVALAATAFPAGWLVDKTSERLAVVLGLVCMVFSPVVFVLSVSFWGFALSWSILGLGIGLLDPAFSSLIAKGVPRRLRGLTFGMVVSSVGIVSLPFPWIGSQVWTYLGPKAPFLLTVLLTSLAIVPAWFKLIPKDSAGPSKAKPIPSSHPG